MGCDLSILALGAQIDTHTAIMKLAIGYSVVGAFVLTLAVTLLSLVGLVKFKKEKQQSILFAAVIVEIVVACLALFGGFMRVDANAVGTEATLRSFASALPPLSGKTIIDGQDRKAMESYLRQFATFDPVFRDDGQPGKTEIDQLLAMVDERKNPRDAENRYYVDERFHARIFSFLVHMQSWVKTGSWPT